MSDLIQNSASENTKQVPAFGDASVAEKYITKLISLIDQDKLDVAHTDLSKFDPSILQDHYRISLPSYQVEISHAKKPDNGQDSFVCLFTNIKNLKEGCEDKVILSYLYLNQSQFESFKKCAENKISRIKKGEEEKRFQEVMAPIEVELDKAAFSTGSETPGSDVLKSPNTDIKVDLFDNTTISDEKPNSSEANSNTINLNPTTPEDKLETEQKNIDTQIL